MTPRPALVLPLAILCACSGSTLQGTPDPQPAGIPEDVARQAAIADSTRNAYTQTDVDFMAGMIHHHAQALTMSRMAPTHGASEPMRILTARIINAQKDEIRLMQQWLRARDLEAPDPPQMHEGAMGGGAAHAGHAAHGAEPEPSGHVGGPGDGDAHGVSMPGMLTPDQLERLDAARGEDWDRLFLQYMIQHHEGAVTMVDRLFATPGAAQEDAVFKLANDIGADQTSEIERMRTMLAQMLVADDG
jgi:uncharacterized protein (DUF305 family)